MASGRCCATPGSLGASTTTIGTSRSSSLRAQTRRNCSSNSSRRAHGSNDSSWCCPHFIKSSSSVSAPAASRRGCLAMDKFWVVAKREYLERVRSRWFVVMTLFVPVFITAIFLIPAWVAARSAAGGTSRNIIIVDATGAGLGQRVADVLVRDTTGLPARGAPLPTPQVRVVDRAALPAAEDSALHEVMRA